MKDNWIFGIGASSAKLMIVGEAPGKHEEKLGKLFVGPSGELVTELLEVTKLSRNQVYLTNVIKVRPPNNDLDTLHLVPNTNKEPTLIGNKYEYPGYKVEDFLPLLWNEIEVMRPNCILALGSLALETLTGYTGIKNYRGSILHSLNYDIKVIPTIHPAALFERPRDRHSKQGMFSWKQKIHIQFDFIKAARESQFPGFDSIPRRDLRVVRSSLELERFFDQYKDSHDKVYVDTEVYKSHLVCVGFAFTPHEAISVPLIDLQSNENPKGIALHELVEIWKIVAEKLEDNNLKKIGQNFKADKIYWLENAGFTINNFYYDTMMKFHTLSPELPKGLAFQASILTNEPFWKGEGREYNPLKDKLDVLLKYNAKDCALNCECDLAMDEDMKEFKLEEFFQSFVVQLQPIYEGIEKKGIRIDKDKQLELSKSYENLLAKENQQAKELLLEFGIEEDFNYNSPKQMVDLIFFRLKCPQRVDTRDETLTALMNNAVKDQRKKKIIKGILDRRSIHKLKETYINAQIDPDGRMRCSYNQVGTETGRTSTSTIKKPLRNSTWGVPFQTIPRPDEFGGRIREMFIPDPGKIFIEFDQSQAEARLVALLAEDYDLLNLYDILDVHKLTASFCYNLTDGRSGQELIKAALPPNNEKFAFLDSVEDAQRQIGKSARHGLAYDLSPDGLSIKMKISLWRAKETFQKVHEMSPKIKGVFHESIQEALSNSRVFYTPFGRRREFFERWGKELFREAYAHIPQSTVGDNTKRCMLAISKIDWIEILQEGHDSFLAQIPPGRERECYEIVKYNFEQPIDFDRCTIKRQLITIPVECKVGESWGTMKKVKF